MQNMVGIVVVQDAEGLSWRDLEWLPEGPDSTIHRERGLLSPACLGAGVDPAFTQTETRMCSLGSGASMGLAAYLVHEERNL